MIELGVKSEILTQIMSGEKTVEGRLAKDKFLSIKPGDIIAVREDFYEDGKIYRSVPDRARIVVDSIDRFGSFEEMLRTVGYKAAIPSARTMHEALAQYRAFYSKDDEKRYGVVALSFHVVTS